MSFPAHEITQGALLEQLARERPGREALIYPQRGLRWTFADLDARVLALARGLIALGVAPGERVTLWADNRPDWIAWQFALARLRKGFYGAKVTVTASVRLKPVGTICRSSQAPGGSSRNQHWKFQVLPAWIVPASPKWPCE